MNVRQVIMALSQLQDTELAQVRDRVNLLLGNAQQQSGAGRVVSDEAVVFDSVVRAVLHHGGPTFTYSEWRRRSLPAQRDQLAEVTPQIMEFVKHFKPEDRRQRVAAVRLVVRIVADNMKIDGIPIKVHRVLRHLPNFRWEIEQQLPGWAEAGMLPRLLQPGASV